MKQGHEFPTAEALATFCLTIGGIVSMQFCYIAHMRMWAKDFCVRLHFMLELTCHIGRCFGAALDHDPQGLTACHTINLWSMLCDPKMPPTLL